MFDLIIKKVVLKEVTDLEKISRKTFLEAYSAGNPEEDLVQYLDEEVSLEKLKLELKNKDSEFYFAILDNEIIGYLKINFSQAQTEIKDDKSLEIQRIYVLEEFQGKRIGKSLYQKAVEIASQKDLDYLWLGVWKENSHAIQFYEKIGFVAFDKHIFQLGSDAQIDIMMKLQLK